MFSLVLASFIGMLLKIIIQYTQVIRYTSSLKLKKKKKKKKKNNNNKKNGTKVLKNHAFKHSELLSQFHGIRSRMYNVGPHDKNVIGTVLTQ